MALRKYVLYFAPPTLFGVEVLLSYKPVNQWVSRWLEIPPDEIVLWSGGILISLFLLHHYVQVIRPIQKYERLENTKRSLLDAQSQIIIDTYKRDYGVELRLNLMTVERVWMSTLEPHDDRSKLFPWTFLTKHLKIFWRSQTMRHSSDANMILAVEQGVAGDAFSKECPIFVDMTQSTGEDYNLNRDQIRKSQDLRFVFSFPVRKLDLGENRITAEVIGVVNIDSIQRNSEKLIQGSEERDRLTKHATAFSEICSQIL